MDSLGGKLQLFFLPPYSPELNPDEKVWNYVKHHGVAKAALRGRDDLKKFVLARLRSLQKLPWTIRMFVRPVSGLESFGRFSGIR